MCGVGCVCRATDTRQTSGLGIVQQSTRPHCFVLEIHRNRFTPFRPEPKNARNLCCFATILCGNGFENVMHYSSAYTQCPYSDFVYMLRQQSQ